MTRDINGRRLVSARMTMGLSLASLAAGFALVTQFASWIGLPSPAQYHQSQMTLLRSIESCATKNDVSAVTDNININFRDVDRRLKEVERLLRAFDITDDEMVRRMRREARGR